jgi:nitrogen PTS system EIIA component
MTLADLVEPEHVIAGLRAGDKAQLLRELALRAADALGIAAPPVLEALRSREQLGSTGLGRGFALPHARLSGIPRLFGLFARLSHPIAFDAIDDAPVDLVFALLAPDHSDRDTLAALATVSRALRDVEFARRLREAKGADALRHLLRREASEAS